MQSQFRSPEIARPVGLRRLAGDLYSVAKQASFSIAFWSNFGGFGRPKSMPKFDFRAFFCDVIFENVLTSKFGRYLEAQNQKNSNFPLEKTVIFTKPAFSIKIQKTMKFHFIFGGQNEKKSNTNRFEKALFLSIAFSAFFL